MSSVPRAVPMLGLMTMSSVPRAVPGVLEEIRPFLKMAGGDVELVSLRSGSRMEASHLPLASPYLPSQARTYPRKPVPTLATPYPPLVQLTPPNRRVLRIPDGLAFGLTLCAARRVCSRRRCSRSRAAAAPSIRCASRSRSDSSATSRHSPTSAGSECRSAPGWAAMPWSASESLPESLPTCRVPPRACCFCHRHRSGRTTAVHRSELLRR